MKLMIRLTSVASLLLLSCGSVAASDVDDLTVMLNDFLAKSHTEAAHQTFWADDLIYTSSAGLRFGKSDILAGFDGTENPEELPDTLYSATDIDVRVHGDTAIVAFKLVGAPTWDADPNLVLYYYNTGTLLRRSGGWQVIAWQATKIPPAE